ncbi:retrovirus-related pol polyprotein from transposon TNT 1-94 [Tanacetum coccineum]
MAEDGKIKIDKFDGHDLGFRIPEEEWQGKEVSLAHLRVFGCDSYVKVKDVARDKLDAKYVKCTFIGYGSDEMGYHFWDSKGHKVVRSRDVTFNEDSLYGAKAVTDSSNLTKPIQKSQEVLVDIPDNLAKDINIVAEHGLSSEITQSPDEEDSEDRAFSEEGGSETSQVRRSTRESMAPVSERRLQTKGCVHLSEYQQERKHHKACGCSRSEKSRIAAKGRKPRVQIEGDSVRTDSSTEATVDDMLVAGYDMAEFNKPKCLAEMFTRLVMKEKLKLCAASTGLRDN